MSVLSNCTLSINHFHERAFAAVFAVAAAVAAVVVVAGYGSSTNLAEQPISFINLLFCRICVLIRFAYFVFYSSPLVKNFYPAKLN